ncbi:MAG: GtrA family protein [Acidimicrobiales bacterium]
MSAFQGERGRLAVRYFAVSVINVANHQVVLYIANTIWGWRAGWANVFAACVAAGPAYLLSRAWVWEVKGKHDLRAEVLPFWILAVVGLVVSTALAAAAGAAFGAGLIVNLASLVGYFIVWVGKFLLLHRIFTPDPATDSTMTHDA